MAEPAPLKLGGTGMLLGKFLPPHLGHQYLIDFARGFVDELTVLCCTLPDDPLPGDRRFAWVREMAGDARTVHVTDVVPQFPQEHPEFWTIWRDLVRRYLPTGPDFVFASEPYGATLAEVLGARFIPVDLPRERVPISATAIRQDPLANWRYLPPCVRPWYVRRVCVFGPESTGKSTLARDLAAHYGTVHTTEFARGLLDPQGGACTPADIPRIARGQAASEEAMARQATRVLFCDTDLCLTTIWSEVLYGACEPWIIEAAAARHYDLYLLTDVDVPWVDDNQRYFPETAARESFRDRCVALLKSTGRPWVRVHGDWDARFATATAAVDAMLAAPRENEA